MLSFASSPTETFAPPVTQHVEVGVSKHITGARAGTCPGLQSAGLTWAPSPKAEALNTREVPKSLMGPPRVQAGIPWKSPQDRTARALT